MNIIEKNNFVISNGGTQKVTLIGSLFILQKFGKD